MLQMEWPMYSIPALQIALVFNFAYELGVTNNSRGYDPLPLLLWKCRAVYGYNGHLNHICGY